jgi:hypothetical protein
LFLHRLLLCGLLACLVGATACRNDMHNQPRYKPFAATPFFGDGRSARPTIDDTVARGQLQTDTARFTGKVNGADINYFPIQIVRGDLERGDASRVPVDDRWRIVAYIRALQYSQDAPPQAVPAGAIQ